MKSLKQLFALLTFGLCLSTTAQAIMVTDTVEITVTSSNNSVFVIGDVITFAATYDDASQYAHDYYDGLNGVGEFGAGDDTLGSTYCTVAVAASDPTCINNGENLFADATFDLSNIYDAFAAVGLTGYDAYNFNYSSTDAGYAGGDNRSYYYLKDDFSFGAFTLDNSIFGVFSQDASGNVVSSYVQFDITKITTERVGVPEPASILLLSAGLFGMSFLRRRKS